MSYAWMIKFACKFHKDLQYLWSLGLMDIFFCWANPSFFTATAQQQLSINLRQKYICIFLFPVGDYCRSLIASPVQSHHPRRTASPFPPPQPDKPLRSLVDTRVHLCAHVACSFSSPAQSQPRSALSIRCSQEFFPTKLIPDITVSPWGSSLPIWYNLCIKGLFLFCPPAAALRAASGQIWTGWVYEFVEPVSFTFGKLG